MDHSKRFYAAMVHDIAKNGKRNMREWLAVLEVVDDALAEAKRIEIARLRASIPDQQGSLPMPSAITKERRAHITAYRKACRLVRSLGMDVVDGLALTFSCADYPSWVRNMNGWPVEDAAVEALKRR